MLLQIDQPYPNHNGGDLALGPDGMLYVAMGDGGSGGDPERRASDPTNLLGKLLRIDPAPSGDAAYSIPADNPFATGSMGDVAGAPEVWAWGLRNPWRIAFDPATAELWIADVGQNRIEEIDAVGPTADHPAGWGTNFGWSAFEGNDRFNDDVADPGNLVFPVWTYTHDEGCSISGGAVYRGTVIAGLAPAYVYSDYCAGSGVGVRPRVGPQRGPRRGARRRWRRCAPDPTASSTCSSAPAASASSSPADTFADSRRRVRTRLRR